MPESRSRLAALPGLLALFLTLSGAARAELDAAASPVPLRLPAAILLVSAPLDPPSRDCRSADFSPLSDGSGLKSALRQSAVTGVQSASPGSVAEPGLPALGTQPLGANRRLPLVSQREWMPYAGGLALLMATDRTTLRWFDADRFAGEDGGSGEGSDLVSGAPLLIELAVPYLVGGRHGRRSAKMALGAAVNAMVVVVPLKWVVGRERPDQSHGGLALHGPGTGDASFPSAHTAAAFAIATVYGRQYRRWRIPIYLLAAGVGLARIEAGRHHLSDVVAGAGIGILAGRASLRGRGQLLTWRF